MKLIAEPWDVGPGGYQLGNFPAGWSEWNDRYRDAVRAYWRGDRPLVGTFAERLAGSSDLFREVGRKPTASINYVAAHDGFTLHDTVSYNEKHNEANLEANRDGHSHNLSSNYGVEGPSNDPRVLRLRERQARNLLATVFLSQGVPMLLAGDEFGRTQRGNNNAYCQDNEIAGSTGHCSKAMPASCQFVRQLIELRKSRLWLRRDTFLKGTRRGAVAKDVTWLHPSGHEMTDADWNDSNLRCISVLMNGAASRNSGEGDLFVIFNADDVGLDVPLPHPPESAAWSVTFDTGEPDRVTDEVRLAVGAAITVRPQSTVLLELKNT